MDSTINSLTRRFEHKRTGDTTNAKAGLILREMFAAAVASADPSRVLAKHLPPPPKSRCVVVGAGKAAASMAAALEAAWPDVPMSGVVAVPYGYSATCKSIRVIEARHPIPDDNSVIAAQAALQAVSGLDAGDLVIALISGGGSATMCLPLPGLSLNDKQITNKLLLNSGLDIRTMNAVRRRISAIKGGKLAAAAAPARVVTLAISDVPGDNPSSIASGPTVPDQTSSLDISGVAEVLGPGLPSRVAHLLRTPASSAVVSNESDFRLIATPAQALESAAAIGRSLGLNVVLLGDHIEGESRLVARDMASAISGYDKPTVVISGGETTVTLGENSGGRGGRNTEFALSLACELAGNPNVWALACDTDGEDGVNLGAAGAIVSPDTLRRASAQALDPFAMLEAHDSGSFFAGLGDLVMTGPTFTNVNDFRAILVLPSAKF